MGTRTAARIAAQGDFLALVHFLSGRYQNLAQMTVAGLFAVRMTAVPFGTAQSIPLCIRPQRHLNVEVRVPPVIGLMYVGGVWVPFSIISGTGSVITFSDTISRPVSVPFLDVVSTVTS